MNGRPVLSRRWLTRLAAVVVLVVAAIVLGWRNGGAPKLHPALAPPAPWVLTAAKAGDFEQDIAFLRARRPFGGQAAFRESEAPAPAPAPARPTQPWRLVGTVLRPDERFALIQIGLGGDGPIEYRGVGDTLPDGDAIVAIDTDSITAQGDTGSSSASVVHRLFEKKP